VCGTLTFDGVCQGTLLRVCDNGVIHEEDCALSDQICLTDANGSSDCAPDPNPGTGGKAGSATGGSAGAGSGAGGAAGSSGGAAGTGTSGAAGTTAGSAGTTAGGTSGKGGSASGTGGSTAGTGGSTAGTGGSTAGTGGAGGGSAGTGGSTTNNCGAVTYEGTCAGDVLQFCDGQNVVTVDCFAKDPQQTCAFITGADLYDCTYDCGNVTFDGECKGNVLRWCEDTQIHSYDCNLDSQTCGADGNSTFYICK
jgi:hypothetical protein